VSVIVPTRNRAAVLRALLDALTHQIYPADRLEIVVVDNASTDDTAAVVAAASARAPFPIHYRRKRDEGPPAARNLGVAVSRGEILAFTDSDCLPSPRWLLGAVARLGERDGLVCGPIVPVDRPDQPVFVHQVIGVDRDNGIYATANVLYRRAAIEAAGGFDEQFGAFDWGTPIGGEDTDLAWRVRRAGWGAVFAPEAVVYHQATPASLRAALLSPVQAQIVPRLLRSVPELRQTYLWRRLFIGRHSAAFYLLLAGLHLGRRRPWALLLAWPWLSLHWPALRPDAWPPRRWPMLALRLGLFLEIGTLLTLVLVWASARYRRLVL
jgi:glycosyltransferase involved in cell wall biosynthesis